MGVYTGNTDFLNKLKHQAFFIIIFIFSCILFRFAYLFQGGFKHVMDVASYLTWHNMFEFAGVLVCFSVFIVPYYTYGQTGGFRTLFLGHVFLFMGLLDTFHSLSFKGMPEFFIINNDANRATTFWILSRLIGGLGFVIASFIPMEKVSKVNKNTLTISTLFLSLTLFAAVTYYPHIFPAMYVEGQGMTAIKKLMESFVIMLLCISIILKLFEYRKSGDQLIILFCGALLLTVFSELAFSSYYSVYDIYNYLGHVYKVIAFFIIFKVIFVYNVQKPYIELSKAKNELSEYVENLDRLVDKRTQQLKSINQKLTDDLEYARDIQKAMLPADLPKGNGVCFSAKYFPAERLSGDFYDAFKLDENNIGLYIGDVSGHGVSAAMLTVFLNQSIKTVQESDIGLEICMPSVVLQNLYKSFNNTNFKEDIYMVLLYGIYNIRTKRFTYSSAGMNVQPFIIDGSGQISELKINGFPICKFMEYFDPDYKDSTIDLKSEDKILFFTDGLVEAENRNGEYFAEKRLTGVLENGYRMSCTDLADSIEKAVFTFTDNRALRDDITLLMMEVK